VTHTEKSSRGPKILGQEHLLRSLPAVHELLNLLRERCPNYPLAVLKEAAREVLDNWRNLIQEVGKEPPGLGELVFEAEERAKKKLLPRLRRVINATGVVIHTNLGRAPLCEEACEALQNIARGYCNLEVNLETGKRGWRYSHVEELLKKLTGAEAALVVNNNAAAVFLALHTLARGKEVVVSRSELVEIGGSFRIPEVMAQSGARLVEVGTTNKTYPRDYEEAIGPETALLMKVHPSNFRILGFTHEVTREELVAIGRKHGVPVLEDLGSGCLVDLRNYGVGAEPPVPASIQAGVDVVTFSGDKLLGGPQAGIIVGRSVYLQKMKENHLLRALRVDKLTIAALEATLRKYLDQGAVESLPVLRMLTLSQEQLAARAEQLKKKIEALVGGSCDVEVEKGVSRVGGGALPLTELPTTLVALRPREMSAEKLLSLLRQGEPPVCARLQSDSVLIDPRTLGDGEEELLVEAVATAVKGRERDKRKGN